MFISLLFFVGTIGLIISMSKIDKQTEDTTTFYTATVNGVEVTDTGEDIFAEIRTKEYGTSLYISKNISKNISMHDVTGLENGQVIFFGIESIKDKQMNEVKFVNIISLKTDAKDIFTLEEYNECMHNKVYPARIASIVMAALFFSISLFCCMKIRRMKKRK